MGRVIAIDGPSGAGKSTVAKEVARRLGFEYLDTGALYRAAALALREAGLEPEASDDSIRKILEAIKITFSDGKVYLDDRDVSVEIRTTEAGHYSSVFSARPVVRELLMPLQRGAAESADLVAEGRDMGTVVFPGAWRKFFLEASSEERTRRRYLQLKEKGMPVTMEEAGSDVTERDMRDSTRDIAPLKPAEGAVIIDTSGISAEDVVRIIVSQATVTSR